MPATDSRPFCIRIFAPHGERDGLRIVDTPNWTGCALICPRSDFPRARAREEFGRTGVYVLTDAPEDGTLPTTYVGRADVLGARLEYHYRELDFWTTATLFTSKDAWLNAGHTGVLETELIRRAREARRSNLTNVTVPRGPALCEADQAEVATFLEEALRIAPLIGLTFFAQAPAREREQDVLVLSASGIVAHGYDSPQGFVICADSQAVAETSPAAVGWLSSLRAGLLEQGVLVRRDGRCEFSQDYVFRSPSTAAGVALGHEINGLTAWKDDAGRTLRELRETEPSAPPSPSGA